MSAISQTLDWQADYLLRGTQRTLESTSFLKRLAAGQLNDLSVPAKEPTLLGLHDRLDQVARLKDNWDGYGSLRPNELAVWTARQFIEDLYRQIIVTSTSDGFGSTTPTWQSPHVSASEDGEIVLEWWSGNRKLTLYINEQHTAYVKSWGPHIVEDMADGLVQNDDTLALWEWLFG